MVPRNRLRSDSSGPSCLVMKSSVSAQVYQSLQPKLAQIGDLLSLQVEWLCINDYLVFDRASSELIWSKYGLFNISETEPPGCNDYARKQSMSQLSVGTYYPKSMSSKGSFSAIERTLPPLMETESNEAVSKYVSSLH
ncbi:unnamed protein product [Protopolystoma xenopodis]|uniref:Uncharacterized protein n=1 Tax=Protopolystoma xenopodis TaxID=117903 RepID=A0A3S4ZS27_9PLAT|nr:unnamed protein product [Protopolystoma xenopodis]